MASSLQFLSYALLLVLLPSALSVPVQRVISRPRSVNVFSPAARYSNYNNYNVNPYLQSKAFSNSHVASALYGAGAYPSSYHPMMGGAGLGTGLSSYSASYGGHINPFSPFPQGQVSTKYENHQRNPFGMGHSVSSKQNSYVGNNYGFPSLGGSYEHSVDVNKGVGAVYPGVYVPIGAKYGSYGSYDHYGYGGHGTYKVTPGFTQITHTQTVPNYGGVNKLRGYGR